MKSDTYFWVLLPIFVAMSGNLAPLRVGPILPIFFLLITFSVLNAKIVINFFRCERLALYAAVFVAIYFAAFTLLPIPGYSLRGDEFLGATNPKIYAIATFIRYAICLFSLLVLAHKPYPINGQTRISLSVTFWLLFVPLILQVFIYAAFSTELGFVFHTGLGVRFGGLIGEPQTAAAWLTCLFFVLYMMEGSTGFPNTSRGWVLLGCEVMVLLITTSTAWIIAFLAFLIWRLGPRLRIAAAVCACTVLPLVGLAVLDKVGREIFEISERSITIVAGFELFATSLHSMLFGYGLGLSPYLMTATDIFKIFPDFNLSDLGRQNVMNSYLEIIFELGMVGAPVFFFLFIKVSKITRWSTAMQIAPVIIGISGVGGGFAAGYLLLAVPLLAKLNEPQNHYAIDTRKRYRIVVDATKKESALSGTPLRPAPSGSKSADL